MERFYKKILKKKEKKTVLLKRRNTEYPYKFLPVMEMLQYPIIEKKNLSCLFNPTTYNTAVMCLLLLTASIKINK